MDNQYVSNKFFSAYELLRQNKFVRKARAIVVKDGRLLVIKIEYNDGRVHFLLPGGTVDPGETIRETAKREAFEEYGIIVKPLKNLGKLYYTVNMNLNGVDFKSRVIDFFYICEFVSIDGSSAFGIDGEFSKNDRKYIKTELSLDDLQKIHHKDLNDMDKKNFEKLIHYMEKMVE